MRVPRPLRTGVAAGALAVLLAAAAAPAGDGNALERFRRAVEGNAPAAERAAAARGMAGVDGRAAAEVACAGLAAALERIDALAKRRSALREEVRALKGDRDGETEFPTEIVRKMQGLHAEEERLRAEDEGEQEVAGLVRALLPAFRDLKALDWLSMYAVKTGAPAAVRAAALEALGGTGGDAAGRAARTALRDRDPSVREAALAALARLRPREEETLRALEASLADARWTVRLAALRRLADMATAEATDLMVARLPAEEGRLRKDLADMLRALTGQNFGPEPEGWTHWWKENRAEFASGKRSLAPGASSPPPEEASGGDGVSYYGITTRSKRILYVLDISGSMQKASGKDGKSTKIEEAKKELMRSVRSLDAGSAFTIYAFHDTVSKWKPALVKASAAAKDEAAAWIAKLGAAAWTNTYAALEEAIRASAADPRNNMGEDYAQAADTIFLLTDGSPTAPGGGLRDAKGNLEWQRVLAAVREWNREKRVVLHCIGVGPEVMTDFLSPLARENGGEYRMVQ